MLISDSNMEYMVKLNPTNNGLLRFCFKLEYLEDEGQLWEMFFFKKYPTPSETI